MPDALSQQNRKSVNFGDKVVQHIVDQSSKDPEPGNIPILKLAVWMKEFHLYGASRLGILNQNDTLKRADLHFKLSLSDPQEEPELFVETIDYNRYGHDSIYTLKLGNKLYEGTNHLGNVLVTFSDKRLGYCEDDTVYRYRADIRTANDYAAFGAPLDDRQWYSTADSGVYRFGFNGMEKDNEVKGVGNSQDFGARIYDARLGRWMSVDAWSEFYTSYSPFVFSLNSPIRLMDPDGNRVIIANEQARKDIEEALKDPEFKKVYDKLENSEVDILIGHTPGSELTSKGGVIYEGKTYWDGGCMIKVEYGHSSGEKVDIGEMSYLSSLYHEVKHAEQIIDGKVGYNMEVTISEGGVTREFALVAYDWIDEYEAYVFASKAPGSNPYLSRYNNPERLYGWMKRFFGDAMPEEYKRAYKSWVDAGKPQNGITRTDAKVEEGNTCPLVEVIYTTPDDSGNDGSTEGN